MSNEIFEGTSIIDKDQGAQKEPFIECLVVDEEGRISKYSIASNRAVIGRATTADVNINDKTINPIHAVIEVDQQKSVHLFDMMSEKGTFVNDKQITDAILEEGDKVRVGTYVVHIRVSFRELDATRTKIKLPKDVPLIDIDQNKVQNIFDFTPCSVKGTVEVIFLYGDEVLDVHFLTREKSFNIGTNKRADFSVKLPKVDLVPIVEKTESGGVRLNIPEVFAGIIRKDKDLFDLDTLKQKLTKNQYGHVIELSQNDFAKLTYRDFSIFVQFTNNPPILISRGTRDEDKFVIMASLLCVLMMTTLITFTGFVNGRPTSISKVEALEKPPSTLVIQELRPKIRMAKVEPKKIQPEPVKVQPKPEVKKTPPPPPPKPIVAPPVPALPQKVTKVQQVPNPTPPDAVKGAVKHEAAAGSPGKAGRPMPNPGTSAVKNNPGPRVKGGEVTPGKSEKPDTGLLDLIAGQGNIAKNKGGGGSTEFLKKINNATQMKGAANPGEGGIGAGGIVGGATRGDIQAKDIGGVGLQKFGSGPGGYGTDPNGSPYGTKDGKGGINVVEYEGEESTVMGAIDPALILRVLEENKDKFQYCYEKELNKGLDSAGKIGVTFVIGASGAVASAGVRNSTLNSAAVQGCVITVLKSLRFPSPVGGGKVTVGHTFGFRQSGR